MRFSKTAILILSLVSLVSLSCKKNEETQDYDYLKGKVSITFPAMVEYGFTKSFQADTMNTLAATDGEKVGLYFRQTIINKSDTVRVEGGSETSVYSITIPDTLGTFTISLSGFHKGCYTSSASSSFDVVKKGFGEGASIQGFTINETDKFMTDARDGRKYYTVMVGDTEWMRQNLAWEGAGMPYRHADAANDIFGRFYDWDEAVSACPEGWTLPSENDWVALAAASGISAQKAVSIDGMASKMVEKIFFNGTILWPYSKTLVPDNRSRFSAMPAGYAALGEGGYSFSGFRKYAMFWSSGASGDSAEFRYINSEKDILYYGLEDKAGFAASVRCVKHN